MVDKKRCAWSLKTEIERNYHDKEWGVPLYDDHKLFEFLCLEGAQAGLSWVTILKRRDDYRKAFDYFDINKIAQYDELKLQSLLQNPNIIRNRLKIKSFVQNAQSFLKIQKEYGSFQKFIWSFMPHEKPLINHWKTMDEIPSETVLSQEISKTLKKKGFSFVGPVICYAFMQATGMVNDHTTDCFRYHQTLL